MEEKLIDIERIKEVRKKTGLSQRSFAESIGMSASQWSAYETGIKNPGLTVLLKIAKKYNVSIDYLCGLSKGLVKSSTMADVAKVFWMLDMGFEGISYDFDLTREKQFRRQGVSWENPHENEINGVSIKFKRDFENEEALNNCLIEFFEDWQEHLGNDPDEFDLWKKKTEIELGDIELSPKSKETLEREREAKLKRLDKKKNQQSRYSSFKNKKDE